MWTRRSRRHAPSREKLNRSADRIDSVLIGAEKFLGSASGESGKGAFDEIRAAAVSVRELADDLNRRTGKA